jgi:hypothetical protein
MDACHLLCTAFCPVTSATITKSLNHAGFCSTPKVEPSEGNEIQPALGEMFTRVSELLNLSSSLNEHVTLDWNVTTAQLLAD